MAVGKIIIAGNWKMHKTQAEALEFLTVLKSKVEETDEAREIVLCVPFTALSILSKSLHGGKVRLGAQNVHWKIKGLPPVKFLVPC